MKIEYFWVIVGGICVFSLPFLLLFVEAALTP